MKEIRYVGIGVMFITVIIIAFFCMYLIQENLTLREKVDKWDSLLYAYKSCDKFRQEQNQCLYDTGTIDYEKCYWKAQGD